LINNIHFLDKASAELIPPLYILHIDFQVQKQNNPENCAQLIDPLDSGFKKLCRILLLESQTLAAKLKLPDIAAPILSKLGQ
jgi:hypothetical protein